MNSISFPKMFETNSTNVRKSFLDSTTQNTLLLLRTEMREMFGDPYIGILLKRYLFEQNSYILRDVLIDEIYTKIALFIPQLKVARRDIKLEKELGKIYCTIKGINQIDFTVDTFSLILYDEDNI